MRIVADENIADLEHCFAECGEVISYPGRSITPETLKDADALLVRSVTSVNENLLKDSSLRFVGTCTAGNDHVDIDYVEKRNIAWAYAPGCNASAVVDYVCAVMHCLNFPMDTKTVGIIGCGNVGGRLKKRLSDLGVKTLCCDPFLEGDDYFPLGEVVRNSDMICIHTPLTRDGLYPTYKLFNENLLAACKEDAILLNAGRGAVVDEDALIKKIDQCPNFSVVLDVWENEPYISNNLLEKVTIATPHIAGYSLQGKLRGTQQVQQAFCQAFGIEAKTDQQHKQTKIVDRHWFNSLNDLVLACYNPLWDDRALRAKPKAFDQLRKNYRQRCEFSAIVVNNVSNRQEALVLKGLGFLVN